MTRLTKKNIIGICGAGAMGAGIAQVASHAGHQVIVYDSFDSSLNNGEALVAKGAKALLKRGKIDETKAAAINARIRWTNSIEDLKNCSLIIEAIIENAEIKKTLFQELEAIIHEDCIIATNTSSLSVSFLASHLEMGLHFFNPAPIMKLVEVIAGAMSEPEQVTSAFELMEVWGKQAVRAKDVPGFIVNRVARPFYGEGWRAYEEQVASPEVIDFLYRDLAGFKMGPLELGDLIGHDINSKAAISIYGSYFGKTRFLPSLAQNQLAQSGLLGRKTGMGVYNYETEETIQPCFDELEGKASHIVRGPKTEIFGDALNIEQFNASLPDGFWSVDDVLIGFSVGQSALAMSNIYASDVAVIDWASGPDSSTSLAYSQSSDDAGIAARGLIAALNKKAVLIKDRPGALVFRTILQLVNASCDGVRDTIADEEAIDTAMKFGVNYPFGPIAWARKFGLKKVISALENIAKETGDRQLYEPNETLRRMAWTKS